MSTTTKPDLASPAPAKAFPAKSRRGLRGNSTFNFWLFTGPFLIGLAIFIYVPIGWSVYLSFFEARFTVTPEKFIGLDNYRHMLTNDDFVGSLGTFTVFAAFIVPTTWALSLGLALLVNRLRFMRAFFRSVFFLPTAVSYVAAALIWKMSIFSGVRFGLMNTLLGWFGIENIAWLADPNPPWYWLVIVTARLWLQSGFYMILFIAALQNIPAELYEAAAIDGAKSGWQTFRYITLPWGCGPPRPRSSCCCSSPPTRPSTSSTTCWTRRPGAARRSWSCISRPWARTRTTAPAARVPSSSPC